MKRIFDIICALAGMILGFPAAILAMIFIKLDSTGPILFKQPRIGLNGKSFIILKFRTMKHTSFHGLNITSESDSRITKVGKVLRKWKIDELPQLFNVLKGDMSIVGPRPEVPEYVKYYDQNQLRVLTVRPGITDLASIKYRNESQLIANSRNGTEFYLNNILPDKIKINLEYLQKKSIVFDLMVVMKTLIVLFVSGKQLSKN